MNLFNLLYEEYHLKRINNEPDIKSVIKSNALSSESELNKSFLKNGINSSMEIISLTEYFLDFFSSHEQYNEEQNKYTYPVKGILLDSMSNQSINNLNGLLDFYKELEVVENVFRYDEAIRVAKDNDISIILINGKRDLEVVYGFVSMISLLKNKKIPVLWFEESFFYLIIDNNMYRIRCD